MKTISTVILLLAFFLTFASLTSANDTESLTLKIEGMSCALCAPAVKKALSGVKGVKSAHVIFDKKEAHVECEQGNVNLQEMIKAVSALGFKASLLKDTD